VRESRIDAHRPANALIALALALITCAAPPTPPTPSPDAAPAPASAPTPDAAHALPGSPVHVVRPGDTLTHIAELYAVVVDQLTEANQLPDADRLAVGQHLQISAPAAGTARAEALVDQAADLYRNARFEVALKRAQQAEAILAARESSSGAAPALGARAAFIAGCALAAFGENEQAVAAFARVRALHPQFEPPEGWLSPRLEKLYLAAQ
jgi:LysM repeat protein